MKYILKQPLVTEKSIREYKENKRATFEVNVAANKTEAINELEKEYSVKVLSASVLSRVGKYKMNRKNGLQIKNADKKIMSFKLDKDSKIDIFEK